jgi:ABC-type branched-subunit amino acid transport system substrate-binding protein
VFSQAFAESLEKGLKGFEGVSFEEHVFNGRELKLELLKQKVFSFKPDIVFISDEIANSATVAKYIYRLDPLIPYLTGDPFGNETSMRTLLKEVPRMRVYYSSLWNEQVKTSENDRFKKLYRAQYPQDLPSQEAALTFDALSILTETLAQTPVNPTVDKVRYYLEHTKFKTTQGEIDFLSGPTHSPVKDVYIKVSNIEKSKWVKTLRVKWKTGP